MLLLTCSSAMHALVPKSTSWSKITAPAAAIISACQPKGKGKGKEKGMPPPFDTSLKVRHFCSRLISKTLITWLHLVVRDAGKGSFYHKGP